MHEAVTQGMVDTSGSGLYTIDAELLSSLKPDVILTQSLCSVCSIDANVVAQIVRKMTPPRPVVVSMNPFSVEEVIADCIAVGEAVGLPGEGQTAAAALTTRLKAAVELVKTLGPPKYGKVSLGIIVPPDTSSFLPPLFPI
jgi:ABC-type Fe3+-hydroxamate transport system substrate-binding protein